MTQECLWLAVTADEYELPIYVEDTVQQLANKLEVKCSTVISSVKKNRSGRNTGRKIIKVTLDPE